VQKCRCSSAGAGMQRRGRGAQVHRCTGAQVQMCRGADVQRWSRGAEVQRYRGAECKGADMKVLSC
jgi:hypothetical protein